MKKELVCEKRDGFWFDSIFHYNGAALSKEAIIIDEKDTDKFVSYINNEKLEQVIVDLWNSDIESLSFLNDISHVKYLVIWGNGVIDNSPIYELKNLKFLKILRPSEIYLDRVHGLEFFVTNDPIKVINIEHAITLKTLELIDPLSKSVYENLNFLKNLKSLDCLSLCGLRINSLKGIEELQKMKVLRLVDLKNLNNIADLINVKNQLTSLKIDNCNKIKNFDVIKDLSALVFLSIDRVKLVPNLDFISNLKKLNSFVSVSTNIIDGNMTPLTNIEHAYVYPIRKHYYIIKHNENKKAKDTDFKYGERKLGEEEIELWRRISY